MIKPSPRVSMELPVNGRVLPTKRTSHPDGVGCEDRVEVEHIRNGRVLFTDEEK
jgi:hypothetical protein